MTLDEKARELRNAYHREYLKEYIRTHPEFREKQREYTRKWRQTHPEKRKEYQRRYWEKKAAQALADEESAKGEVNHGTVHTNRHDSKDGSAV